MSSKVPNDSTNGQTSRMICINGTRVKEDITKSSNP
jgi:hypothetical protein